MQGTMIKNMLTTFLARFFTAGANLVIAILLSNYLGAAGRGEQSLVITLITFVLIISSVIGSSTISYLLPRFSFHALIMPSFVWVFLVSAAGLVFLPFTNLVPAKYVHDVCFLSFLLGIYSINVSVLVSRQRINAANILGIIQSLIIIAMLLLLFVALGKRNVHSYVLSLYAGYGGSLFVSLLFTRKYYGNFTIKFATQSFGALKQLFILGFYNQIAVFTQMLSFRLSYYIINEYHGRESVGIYANAVSIAESIWLISRSMATVQHSKIVNSNDRKSSLRLTSAINKANILISVSLLLILSLIPASLYVSIFGPEFTGINHIIWTLAPGILFFGISLILGYYFSSTGKHFVNAIASSAGLIVTLALGFILIPRWNTNGAGITASISYGITALIVTLFYFCERKK
jgi:O-antigen/teichoic acid export membrane protein